MLKRSLWILSSDIYKCHIMFVYLYGVQCLEKKNMWITAIWFKLDQNDIIIHNVCGFRLHFQVLWLTHAWQVVSSTYRRPKLECEIKKKKAIPGSGCWWRHAKSMRKDWRRWEYMTGLSVCIFLPLSFSIPSLSASYSAQLSVPADKQAWLLDITPIWETQS